MIVVWFRA